MIDRVNRDALAQCLRQWASGRLPEDQLLGAIKPIVQSTRDLGVRGVISDLRAIDGVPSLMLSEITPAIPPRWRSKRSKAVRRARRSMARIVVFLHSDLEFEWPFNDEDSPPHWLERPINYLLLGCFILGVSLVIYASAAHPKGNLAMWGMALIAICFGAIAIIFHITMVAVLIRYVILRRWRRWRGRIDPAFDLWPFKRQEDLDKELARRPRLLGGGTKT